MKVFRTVGNGVNLIAGGIVKGGVHVTSSIVSTKFPKTGAYLKEVGNSVVDSSAKVISNTAHFADGAANGIYGAVTKDPRRLEEGWDDIKSSSKNTVKGIGSGIVYTGSALGQTLKGAAFQDKELVIEGIKKVGKVATVGALGLGIIDVLVDENTVQAEELVTRNGHLDGSVHELSNVQFEKNISVQTDGTEIEGVFPVFDTHFEATLPEETYLMSDTVHIGIANMQLYEAIQDNPSLADQLGFNEQDIVNLKSSVTPEGYDWHHHEEPGRIQLVKEEIHGMTGHTGGRVIWGGGSEFR
ncbi:HNH endonuclease [Sporosarcina thermotolerans]|uniref:HNH endonuclease n=1 Tax=Sporosarcina thermotolerans TaxID=633404 RepID=A0AAW9A5J8_9BACL|nr:HNH endonuclease [Sporosarcina thermotolerans]MDW0116174.1 HNH endonuclease [Sporosarcina thermotolerans]WHT48150.1 HNH endonuclease [Sporosarcina thermotolerans]